MRHPVLPDTRWGQTPWKVLAVAVGFAAALLATALVMDAVRPEPPPATADAAAQQFATAYASGDTPAACALTSASARVKMQAAGWCDTSPGWSSGITAVDHCQLPDARWVYVYRTTNLVDASTFFTLYVGGLNNVWLVTGVGRGGSGQDGDPNICELTR